MNKKIKVGDIVKSEVWMEEGLVINSIEKTKTGLKINGVLFEDADYDDFDKIGVRK